MGFLVTFLEGVITFVSPCLLSMLPIYVAFFAGGGDVRLDTVAGDGKHAQRSRLRSTLVCAAGFVAGFTVLFCALGALSGALGSALVRYQAVVDAVCGIVVIVLGLNYLGVLGIPLLQRTFKPGYQVVPRGFFSSLIFGMVFALGWTPCVGAFLGSALSLAATSGQALMGVALLLCYSAGLGVPFFITAVLLDQLQGALVWVKAHYDVVNRVSGGLLVIVGLLMATGQFGVWLRALSF